MRLNYEPGLDGVRAIAAFAVVAFHATPTFGGFIGVDVFFVLSGYLITTLLRAEIATRGQVDLRSFYARRFRRLYPALLGLLVVYLALAPALWPATPSAQHISSALSAALYLSDFTATAGAGSTMLRHTWSLAVEAQFYLIWPLLLPAILLSGRAPWLLAGLWAAACLYRAGMAADWSFAYFRPDTHCSGLILGALLTYAPWRKPWMATFGALTLAALFTLLRYKEAHSLSIGIPAAEIAAALLILGVLSGRGWIAAALAAPAARWGGLLSYGVYLWHYPIARLLREILPWWLTLPVTLALSVLLAAASYFTIEAAFRSSARLRPQPSSA